MCVPCQIRVDDMDLAGELVQDLCRYLGLDELESTATFPNEMESLRSVLSKVRGRAGGADQRAGHERPGSPVDDEEGRPH